MSQIITSLSEHRRRRKAGKDKTIAFAREDLHKQTDVLFVGLQERPGHVVAIVSPEGRAAVETIFVGNLIEWTPVRATASLFPDDWREFDFVVPGIVGDLKRLRLPAPELPQHLLDITPVDEMSPDQLSCMMMFAANHQGVRAMMFSELSKEYTSSVPKNCLN